MAATEPTTAKGQKTRARIVQAAAELVAEKGAVAVSLDDVGARAGASRSQLYHYFDDKADLIRAVVAATTTAVLETQNDHLGRLESFAAIAAWFDSLVALQEAREARGGCPIGSLVGQLAERDERARVALETSFEDWQGHLTSGLSRMRERGELTPDADPVRLATATMASVQGGLLLSQVRRDPGQLRTALDAAMIALRAAAVSRRGT
ncbi:MAG TPA: TetR family transcriptional regulator [Solirubrobacteraceae bacterium]|nr:TetR family transcriptional regulator [Solirubrobacteraceae bacterium]